eukprot:6178357-Pleurochrysis_carterae.AAC.1
MRLPQSWHCSYAWQGGCALKERGAYAKTACLEPLRLPACRPISERGIPHFRPLCRQTSALPGSGCRALARSLQLLWRLPAPWRVESKRAGVRVGREGM